MEKKLRELVNVWTNDLNHNVIPFWQKYSVDRVHGGYFTHLDKNGDRYVTTSNSVRENAKITINKTDSQIQSICGYKDVKCGCSHDCSILRTW